MGADADESPEADDQLEAAYIEAWAEYEDNRPARPPMSDDELAAFYDVPENREPLGPAYRLWLVTINGNLHMRVSAVTAAEAATTAGARWRALHTDGGGIDSIDVRRARP